MRLRAALATAGSAARMYRGTALLVGATAALALAAVTPVASLVAAGAGVRSRLQLASTSSALEGLPIATPRTTIAMAQAETIQDLFGFLVAGAVATAVVAVVTLLLLWFARARAREGEIAVRRAAGASRRVLVLAAVLEGLAVFLLATGTGAPVGLGLGAVAAATWPGTLAEGSLRVLALMVAGLGLVLLLGAEVPALFVDRRRVVEVEATPTAFFFPAVLQLGTCLIALTTTALLLRHLATAAEGGESRGTIYPVRSPAADMAGRRTDYSALLALAPGASLTALGTHLGLAPAARITTDCGNCYVGGIYMRFLRPRSAHHFASADTFRLLGLRLVAGRFLTRGDVATAPSVAVVSQSLANRYFENGAPLGRGVQLGDDRSDWYTVVGIVSDLRGPGFGTGRLPPEQVWVSVLQAPPPVAELLVPPGGPVPVSSMLGPGQALAAWQAAQRAPTRWHGRWFAAGTGLLLALATLGVAAFARLWVLSLRPVLGLHRAAGARRRQAVGLVLGQAALVGIAGTAMGAWFGPAVWRSLPAALPGLPAWDPLAFAGAAAGLVLLMLAAAFVPAARAAREAPAALVAGAEEA